MSSSTKTRNARHWLAGESRKTDTAYEVDGRYIALSFVTVKCRDPAESATPTPMKIRPDTGQILRRARRRRGMTQPALGEAAGLPERAVRRLEISTGSVGNLIAALDVDHDPQG